MATLRVFTDRRCLEHRSPPGFPEVPRRVDAIVEHLGTLGVAVEEGGDRPLADAEVDAAVGAVHDPAYVARFERAVRRGDGLLDSADNPLSPGTWTAARAAVASGLRAVAWAREGDGPRHAFVAVRPPGHHAERATAMGFCYLASVAIAAERLRRDGVPRVAIVDFDVHHGNGTQHLFEERGDVFFASLHQYPFYPGTGAVGERGRGDGAGATLNVPLPAGTGDEGYADAFETAVLPAVRAFAPSALLVSAGFDAWRGDPLGGMRVSEEGFARWGTWLRDLAAETCDGRVVSFLEGGYDLDALPRLAAAYLGVAR